MSPETDAEREKARTLDAIENWHQHEAIASAKVRSMRTYPSAEATMARRLARDFSLVEPTPDQRARLDEIRRHCMAAATIVTRYCPVGREQSLALTALQEVVMWAAAGIRQEG